MVVLGQGVGSSLLALSAVFNAAAVQSATPSVSISETSSWQQYIQGPSSSTVLPVAVLSGSVTGSVTNPEGLLASGGASAQFSASVPATPPAWPQGTTANASSFHATNMGGGVTRTYEPGNAIDGDVSTFWNDDTLGAYPDVLTIISASAVSLAGITIVSQADGVPVNLNVEYLKADNTWATGGTVTGNADVQFKVPFSSTVNTKMVKITVTKDQAVTAGEYTRISEVYPGLVDTATPPSLIVDFGKVVVGFLNIAFSGASSNKPGIQLAFSETTEFLTTVSDFTRSDNGATITPGTDQIAVSPSAYTWTDSYGCADRTKVCADGLHGFRYVKISLDALSSDSPDTSASGNVSIDAVSLTFTGFVGTPKSFSGWFESSDTDLNKYWYDASYTNELCIDTFRQNDTDPRNAFSSTLDGKLVLMDGAKRDRDPYVGDVAVSGKTAFLTHSSASIASRNVLADLGDHQRADGWIPPASINNYGLQLFDYPLWWVVSSYDLLTYTSDTSFATTYYPVLVKVLDTYYTTATDLSTSLLNKLTSSGSSGYGDYAFLPRTGTVTYYNALYVLALKNAASIATSLNKPADASRWLARVATVSDAVNANLWDNTTGAYWDELETKTTHSQDGNSLAVIAGIASPAQATSLLNYWNSLSLPYGNPFYDSPPTPSNGDFSTRVYAFISYFELCARFLTSSQSDSAIEEIKRLYGWMSTNDPKTTFWEGIGQGGSMYEGAFTSAAHGWSTGVLPALTNFVLGVTPTGMGFANFTVKPIAAGGVSWARGVVPTPKGGLNVDWQTAAAGIGAAFNMTLTVPAGTGGVVSVPVKSKTTKVTVNRATAWDGTSLKYGARYEDDGFVAMDITDGDWVFTVAG